MEEPKKKKSLFQAQIQNILQESKFYAGEGQSAEHSRTSEEQHHLHQGLQWPKGRGPSGAVMDFYLFSFSRMGTRYTWIWLVGIKRASPYTGPAELASLFLTSRDTVSPPWSD